jgi:hypothetical protein
MLKTVIITKVEERTDNETTYGNEEKRKLKYKSVSENKIRNEIHIVEAAYVLQPKGE